MKIWQKKSVESISDVKEWVWEDNPRKIDEVSLEGLGDSLQGFGLLKPVVVNERNMTLVAGHQRIKAAERRGEDEVLVRWIDVPEEQAESLGIALNNPNLRGTEVEDKLAEVFSEFDRSNHDLLDRAGYSKADIMSVLIDQRKDQLSRKGRGDNRKFSKQLKDFDESRETDLSESEQKGDNPDNGQQNRSKSIDNSGVGRDDGVDYESFQFNYLPGRKNLVVKTINKLQSKLGYERKGKLAFELVLEEYNNRIEGSDE